MNCSDSRLVSIRAHGERAHGWTCARDHGPGAWISPLSARELLELLELELRWSLTVASMVDTVVQCCVNLHESNEKVVKNLLELFAINGGRQKESTVFRSKVCQDVRRPAP